jgi:cytochrome P450
MFPENNNRLALVLSILKVALKAFGVTSVLGLIISAIRARIRDREYRKYTNNIPGTIGSTLLIGETLQFAANPRNFQWDRFEKYGPVFRTRIIGHDCVFVGKPEQVAWLFTSPKELEDQTFDSFAELLEGFMLIMPPGPHARARRLVTKTLSATRLHLNLSVFAEDFASQVDAWYDASRGTKPLDFYEIVNTAVWRAISRVVLGSDVSEIDLAEIRGNVGDYSKGFISLPVNLGRYSTYGQALISRQRIMEYVKQEVRRRRADPVKYAGRPDLLQEMVVSVDEETNTAYSEKEICELFITIIFGSLDTTLSLFVMVYDMINRDERVKAKVMTECSTVFAGVQPKDMGKTELLNKLPYLDCTIAEVLRLKSPFSFAPRKAPNDVQIPGTDYVIP